VACKGRANANLILMRRLIFSLFAVCLLALTLSAQEKQDRFAGRRAPGFSLMDLNYNQHDLADYRGRVVLLDFIRTDCPLCQTFAGVGEKIRTRFGDRVAVLTIVNAPPDNMKTVGEFIEKHGVKSPVLFDTFQMAASYMKLTPVATQFALPHLFLIDANGQIRHDWEYDGSNDAYFSGDAKPLMAEIEALIAQAPKAAPASKK
jgi:peroxiredoxin